MSKKRKQYDDDDGSVIAGMNVEGMPWYNEAPEDLIPKSSGDENNDSYVPTRQEELWIMWGAMKAAMLAALIVGGILVITVLIFLGLGWFGNTFYG